MPSLKIGYVARHNSGGNDDEGAITYALRQLGHQVELVDESRGYRVNRLGRLDFVLFHKWPDPLQALISLKGHTTRVLWYFDLVEQHEPMTQVRTDQRINWMNKVLPETDIVFCTDGDWVDKNQETQKFPGTKFVHLPQGADERYLTPPIPLDRKDKQLTAPILFTGTSRGGELRELFVHTMRKVWGDRFNHVERRLHGGRLIELVQKSDVVVCPWGPVSDRYWSNRVYLMSGYGGCVVHPYSKGLAEHYKSGSEVVYYDSLDSLKDQISLLLRHPKIQYETAVRCFKRTQNEHLYRHRCQQLIQTVLEYQWRA